MMQGPHVNPPQGSVPPQAASHQAQQPKHRGMFIVIVLDLFLLAKHILCIKTK